MTIVRLQKLFGELNLIREFGYLCREIRNKAVDIWK